MSFASVLLPLPTREPYTYQIPATLGDRVLPGARVVVPVRNQEMIGVVHAVGVEPPAAEPRDLLGVLDATPSVSAALLRTAEWMAAYYGAPLGLALRTMLPGALWGRSRVRIRRVSGAPVVGGVGGELLRWLEFRDEGALIATASRALRRPLWDVVDRLVRVGAVAVEVEPAETTGGVREERVVVLAQSLTLLEREARFRKAPKQRAAYEALDAQGGTAPWRHLRERHGCSDGVIQALVHRGVATVQRVEAPRDPFATEPVSLPPATLTGAQREAVTRIDALAPGTGALLFGVTGSGKTLVYLEAMRRTLAAGRGAILLVPEIGLTPQTVARVRGMFGDQVAVLHSGLSEGERADAWRRLHRGERRVAVGARSAVFAPVAALGLIIIDEEHETSYKNGETPRYHAREVARVRCHLEGARFVLGSATPSLESVGMVPETLLRLDLPERVHARPLPPVTTIDLRHAPLVPRTGGVPWSEALDEALGAALARGEQALLLLNRRGYASFLQCPSCGVVPDCPRCSITLTLHRAPDLLRCHYCDHRAGVPEACAACGHKVQVTRGFGTQQIERLVAERFPEARLARMDLDTTSTRWSHHRILGAVARQEIDVLIGTQMIAKGIDLPEVTFVGVIDADLALHLPDFRASERTFQLLTQVAGRAGRGDKAGTVVIQTRQPTHHALTFAARHDVEGFLQAELEGRRSPPYPPHLALVNVLVTGPSETEVVERATRVGNWCVALGERHGLAVDVLGPAPCAIGRIKDRWRWHVLLKGESTVLGRVVRAMAPRLREGPVRVILDRDPVSLL